MTTTTMKYLKRGVFLLLIVVCGFYLADYELIARTKIALASNPTASTIASIQNGEDLYKTMCTSCHGLKATGDGELATSIPTPPADLTRLDQPSGITAMKIYFGSPPMPAWRDQFEMQQIWDLVNYIESVQMK